MPNQQTQSPSINTNHTAYKKASFLERFVAFLIDLIIVLVLYYILSALLESLHIQIPFMNYIFASLYGTIFVWIKGATPGKMLLKLKVVSSKYEPVGFWHALLRESIAKDISTLAFGLGNLWMLIDKKNQTWHDKLADTFVVKLDKTGKLTPSGSNEIVTRNRKQAFWILVLFNPGTIACVFLIIYVYLFRPFQISGNAMDPNYITGQYYITSKHYGVLTRGDVIVHKAPMDGSKNFIKRIIGLPGDTVILKEGFVYVNGSKLDEQAYLSRDVLTYGGSFLRENEPVTIPAGKYIVLGDNRPFSSDSREWGFLMQDDIISKVAFCYWKCNLSTEQASL